MVPITFKVYGKYALFSDPITRVGGEKSSYPVPTYEALKGIVSSIYWKPTLIWFIDKVRIMKPIHTVSKGIRTLMYSNNKKDLSCYSYLADCEYQVQAHFEWNMNRPEFAADRIEKKHLEIIRRMLLYGGRRDIFLGTRECQAYVEPCEFGSGPGPYDGLDEFPFGVMLHGFTYADEAYSEETRNKMTIRFWNPIMRHGVIDFIRPDQCSPRMCKFVRNMEIKQFPDKSDKGVV